MINGNAVGGTAPIKTVKLVDENGMEFLGVVTESEVIFTATDNDVREGAVYASDSGVSTGTKNIPAYYCRYGHKVILAGKSATITCPEYDYKNLLVSIVTYDTSWDKSTLSTYVSVDDGMYAVGNATKLSDIIISRDDEQIQLGITVDEKSVLRYFVVREEI